MIANTYGSRGIYIERGEGVYLFDNKGKRYIDCFSNMGVNVLGHNVKEVNDAVNLQMQKITNLHGSFQSEIREKFAEKLTKKTSMDAVFFCNSGAEAIEAAMKFARLCTGRKEIISAKMGYHGKTFGALSLTRTMAKYNEPFMPLLTDVNHFSYNDIESLRSIISKDTAAVFLEPIQGEGGIKVPDSDFFTNVRKICDELGVLLVIDEIQTGMGRTGKFLAIEHFNIKPDMIAMAKGLAGGLPAGAVMITKEINSKLFSGCHTNTFGGNPLISASGLAAIEYIENHNLLENARINGEYFINELKKIDSSIIREVRGLGLMIAIELKVKNSEYAKKLQDNGLIVIPTLANVLRLLPPIVINRETIDEALDIIRSSLN